MISANDIKAATEEHILIAIMRDAASERNCELNEEDSFSEQAEFFRLEAQGVYFDPDEVVAMKELAELLDIAEQRLEEIVLN